MQRKTRTSAFIVLLLCGSPLSACKKPSSTERSDASASALPAEAAAPTPSERPQMGPTGEQGSLDATRAAAKAGLETPPLKPPGDALPAPGGVRWQLISNGHEPPLGANDVLNADTTVWTTDGTQAVSSFELPLVGAIKLTSVSEPFRDLLQRLKPPAVARYWIPKQALAGWRPERWPDADLILQVNAYSVARSNEPLAAWGPAPAASGPPQDAQKGPNGFFYKTLERASTTPVPEGRPIKLVWTGWVIEGLVVRKLSRSVQQTQTTLEKVPGGLGPIVKTMALRETRRIWIPKSKAGAIAPDAKGLDLVVDLLVTE